MAVSGLTSPQAATMEDGHFFVVEAASPTVVTERSTDGTVLATFGGSGDPLSGAGGIGGIAVDPTGTYVYVANTGNNRIVRFTISDGTQLDIPVADTPKGIAVGPDGSVYVAEYYAGTIVSMAADGSDQTTVVSGLSRPNGVAVSVAGDLCYDDNGSQEITELASGSSTPSVYAQHPDICWGPGTLFFDPTSGRLDVGDVQCLYLLSLPSANDVDQIIPNENTASEHDEPYISAFSGPDGTIYGLGEWTGEIWAITPPVAPGQPTDVTASTAGDGMANVSWTAPSSDGGAGITSFTATADPGDESCTAGGGGAGCTISGLTDGDSYTFTVTATNEAGTGLASDPSDPFTPTASITPDDPTNVVLTTADGVATVTWTASSNETDADVTDYQVEVDDMNGVLGTCDVSVPATDSLSCSVTVGDDDPVLAGVQATSDTTGLWSNEIYTDAVIPGAISPGVRWSHGGYDLTFPQITSAPISGLFSGYQVTASIPSLGTSHTETTQGWCKPDRSSAEAHCALRFGGIPSDTEVDFAISLMPSRFLDGLMGTTTAEVTDLSSTHWSTPSRPTGLVVTRRSARSVTVDWQAATTSSGAAVSYLVEITDVRGDVLASCATSSTSCDLTFSRAGGTSVAVVQAQVAASGGAGPESTNALRFTFR